MRTKHQAHRRIGTWGLVCLAVALQLFACVEALADDGYRLWLGYDPLSANVAKGYRARITSVVVQGQSPTLDAVRTELVGGCTGLLGGPVPLALKVERDGAVVAGTPSGSPLIDGLGWHKQLAALGPEGFRIRTVRLGGRAVTVIASQGETGALYGAFHFLRLMQTGQSISNRPLAKVG